MNIMKNEKLNRLIDEAGFVRFSTEENPETPIDWSSDYSVELEKFAELIVRECIEIANQVKDDKFDVVGTEQYYRKGLSDGSKNAVSEIKNRLKLHFGIEE